MSARRRKHSTSTSRDETKPEPKAAEGWAWAEGWGAGYAYANPRNPYPESSAAAASYEQGVREGRAARADGRRWANAGDAAGAAGVAAQDARGRTRSIDAHVLGIDDDCSDETLRTAYRNAVFENHPDRGGSETRLKAINAAYERMKRARGHT
jgi:DnaJ-like protein